MKTFIASLLIFALLCVFVGINSAKTLTHNGLLTTSDLFQF